VCLLAFLPGASFCAPGQKQAKSNLIVRKWSMMNNQLPTVIFLLPSVLRIFTTVEDSLQIDPFMQNKPNFRKSQMNVNAIIIKDYENETLSRRGKNKPNSNPIKPNTKPIKANKMPKQTQNKPKTNPIKPNPPAPFEYKARA